ncbi:MAG: NADH:flavin oxidoreductase [Rhodospirillales bacterium]
MSGLNPEEARLADNDPLLQPYRLKHLTLRNRFLSTAHEPDYSDAGLPAERYRLYHREKARGGIGLTMIGGSAIVAEDSPPAFGNLHLYDDAIVSHFQALADAVHEEGAAVMCQITHLGRRTGWNGGDWLPVVAPSPVREPAHRAMPKEMEDFDFTRIVAAYADAAERCIAGGLDGVEIEAYGHLFDAFWSPDTNRREDAYGFGSIENRLRFGMEVLAAIRERLGQHPIVGLRMVCDEDDARGMTRADGFEIAHRLADSGHIDFINVIRGRIHSDEAMTQVIPNMGATSAPHLDFAGEVRREIGVPTFHAARISDVATARHAVASGLLDLVGMTRPHLADPHIAAKVARGEEALIRPCVGAGYCIDRIYEMGEALCIHNPATGREATLPHVLTKASRARRVVVVGGGPGGLEAARVAAERGHSVTLFEAQDEPGGQIRLAASLKRRRELIGIVDWRVGECERLGVELRFNAWAEAEEVLAESPDLVVVASGGLPNTGFLEAGEELAVTTWDLLSGQVAPAEEVLLYDDHAGHNAMTCAEFLTERGVALTLVTPERSLAPDVGGTNYPQYVRALSRAKAEIRLFERLEALRRDGNRLLATFRNDYSKETLERSAQQIVVEHGTLPMADLYFALKPLSRNGGEVDHKALIGRRPPLPQHSPQAAFDLVRIGDAVSGRNIHAAIYDALRIVSLV